jgi:hypothetical protein
VEFTFGTLSILELGKTISPMLVNGGISRQAELVIYVNKDEFKKIDEDLYYRNKKEDSQEFIPSDGEIVVNIDMVKIIIKELD